MNSYSLKHLVTLIIIFALQVVFREYGWMLVSGFLRVLLWIWAIFVLLKLAASLRRRRFRQATSIAAAPIALGLFLAVAGIISLSAEKTRFQVWKGAYMSDLSKAKFNPSDIKNRL